MTCSIRLPKRLPDRDGTAALEGAIVGVTFECWQTGVPGLLAARITAPTPGEAQYAVMHADSMRAVCFGGRLGLSIMIARHMRGLLDWSAPMEALVAEHRSRGLGNRIGFEALLCDFRRQNLRVACRSAEALRRMVRRRALLAEFMAARRDAQ